MFNPGIELENVRAFEAAELDLFARTESRLQTGFIAPAEVAETSCVSVQPVLCPEPSCTKHTCGVLYVMHICYASRVGDFFAADKTRVQ